MKLLLVGVMSTPLTFAMAAHASTCSGPSKHKIPVTVYNIRAQNATGGISNKNAADELGDMSFIFGSRGNPKPRGVTQYYDGIIQMVFVSVTDWGDYLQCEHAPGSTEYTCKCNLWTKVCNHQKAGKENNAINDHHNWYSFPTAGQGIYWDYESGAGCETVEVTSSCVIRALAIAAGCTGQCDSADNANACTTCVHKLSDQQKLDVWNSAISKCPRLSSQTTANSAVVV